MNVLVALYADLELYPPSLNAVRELAARVNHVHVVQRSLGFSCVKLPSNVTVTSAVQRAGELELRSISSIEKTHDFFRFVRCLRTVISQEYPRLIVAYDPIPLLASRLIRERKKSCKIWYHNHDKEARNTNRVLSLGWWAYISEASAFRNIDFFSIPARERLPLFNTGQLKTDPLILPNYPSLERLRRRPLECAAEVIRLVYQGSLGRQHGFKEIIPWLSRTVSGKHLHLTLIGKIDAKYRDELLDLARVNEVEDRFSIRNFVPFTELQSTLEVFNIGLAIHKPIGVTYSTGGTASNKIYEYAAAGLPVILYDSAHYRKYFECRSWVAFSSLNWKALSGAIEMLMKNLEKRSNSAMDDVRNELNFQDVFEKTWKSINYKLIEAESCNSSSSE